jgi:hypothetical protein
MNVLTWCFYGALIAGGLYLLFRHTKKTDEPQDIPVPNEYSGTDYPTPPVEQPKPKIIHRVKAVIKKVVPKKIAKKK